MTLDFYVLVTSTKHCTSYSLHPSYEEAFDILHDFVAENWKESCKGTMPEDKHDAVMDYFEQNFWDEWWEIEYVPFGVTKREQEYLCSKLREMNVCSQGGSSIKSRDEEEIR